MTPGARVRAAIEILEGLDASSLPADRFIQEWFRARRYAGSKDRAAVAERVFDALRHRASYSWRMRSEAPRALAIAQLLAEDADVTTLFSGVGYGPAPLSDAERTAIAHPPEGEPPLHAALEFPQFLEEELTRSLGTSLEAEMAAMQTRASVDLRVNTLKASRADVLAELRDDGIEARPTPYSPVGIRIDAREGLSVLKRHALFEAGQFEFQDEASQMVAMLASAKPGSRVLDLAAGAGGKALALAANMHNEGKIVASDIHRARLLQIEKRAGRAGVTIIRTQTDIPDEMFDTVLIDAPCSGSGAWRRQPEQKWRLTQPRLDELMALQTRLLALGAGRVRPGGRIVYATCSLLKCENEDHVSAFLAKHARFALLPAAEAWRESTGLAAPPGMAEFFRASPATTGTDGFFAAIFVHDGRAHGE